MKKSLRFLALLLVVCLSFGSLSAYALSPSAAEEIPAINNNTYVKFAKDVPVSVTSFLESKGATISDNSVVEVLDSRTTDKAAISVTSISGDSITQDIFFAFEKQDNGDMRLDNSLPRALAANSVTNFQGSFTWENRFVVRATGTAEVYKDGYFKTYYRPTGMSFWYETYQTVDIRSIRVDFLMNGFLYSYPKYELIQDNEYYYTVTKSVNYPTKNTTYSASKSLSSGWVMDTSAGGYDVGQFFYFAINVGGSVYEDEVIASNRT